MHALVNSAQRVWTPVVCLALLCGLFVPTSAQTNRHKPAPPAQERSDAGGANADGPSLVVPLRELGATVAIIPWNYKNSHDAAIQSANEVCSQLLLGTGLNVFLIKSASGAMPPPMSGVSGSKKQQSAFENLVDKGRTLVTQEAPNRDNPTFLLPTAEQMIAIGEKLHPRYVLAGRAQWRSKYVWVGVSNRTKSICTVDLRILDVSSRKLVVDAHGVEGDSTENRNLFNTFTTILSLNPLPLVVPGGVGPQEQRAVTVAIARAMRPWLKSERIHMALDQAEESAAEAQGAKPEGHFTDLLSPLTDLEADLNVTAPAEKQVDMGDKELNRLYALHDVALRYKEPNQIRLSANSPKDGAETLLINEEERSFAVGTGKKVARKDITNSPAKQNLLFEFCGLLTTGTFDTMRARFVKEEKLEGTSTLVYDLTYWGIDDGPYHRVWIDPDHRLIVKRAQFDATSKLKNIVYYKEPVPVAPNIWLPHVVTYQDANHKEIATIRISKPQANSGLQDSVFTLGIP